MLLAALFVRTAAVLNTGALPVASVGPSPLAVLTNPYPNETANLSVELGSAPILSVYI